MQEKIKQSLPNLHGAGSKELAEVSEPAREKKPVFTYIKELTPRANYDNYLFRCHDFNKLMGGVPKPLTAKQIETYNAYHERFMGTGRKLTEKQEYDYYSLGAKLREKPKLSDAAKKHCEQLVREDKTGRRQIIETEYMDKGLICENSAIEMYGKFIEQELKKNTERKQNDIVSGEADQVGADIIREFKTSWDHTTFPLAAEKPTNPAYEWQVQLYMDLYGKDRAELIYTLVDTPERLINDVLLSLSYKYDTMNVEGDVRPEHIPFVVEKVCNMIYDTDNLIEVCENSSLLELKWFDGKFIHLTPEQRIKVFYFERDEKMLSQAREMVALARDYMNKRNKKS